MLTKEKLPSVFTLKCAFYSQCKTNYLSWNHQESIKQNRRQHNDNAHRNNNDMNRYFMLRCIDVFFTYINVIDCRLNM